MVKRWTLPVVMAITFAGAAVADVGAAAGTLTYNKNIAPLFQAHCQQCHHADTIAPMSLMTYEEVRPWVKSIQKAVVNKVMPPWHADPAHGAFSNDRRLTQEAIDTINAWIQQGAKPGDPVDHPPALTFEPGWMIGKPDVILMMEEEFTVGADVVDEYVYFNVPTNFTEDVWAEAIECRPGNRDVVHHIIANPVGGWAPGSIPEVFEPGLGRLIPAGTVIRMQMHYHKEKGVVMKDRSSIGIRFARNPVKQQVHTAWIDNWGFQIPPNTEKHPVTSEFVFSHDAHIKSFMPHMHVRGNDMMYTAHFPDGREEVLLSVPAYDFEWQTTYRLDEPIAAPKGTRVVVEAHFNNSASNPVNPDPNVTVYPGEATTDEMMIGYLHYTIDEEDVQSGNIIRTGRRGGPGGGQGGGPGRNFDLSTMISRFDANGDGKLQKSEAPGPMQRFFDRLDADGDGAISEEEAKQAAALFGQGRRGRTDEP